MSARDPDLLLLRRISKGDEVAVRQLIADKLPRLTALCVRLLGDKSEADDVVQETFVRTWRISSRWKPGKARLETWMHTVALNLCRDRMRRQRRLKFGDAPDQVDPAPSADENIECDDRAKLVADALAKLPERQREALVLQYYQDLSNNVAAEVMGISIEALESLLSRGRRRLRELLIEQRP